MNGEVRQLMLNVSSLFTRGKQHMEYLQIKRNHNQQRISLKWSLLLALILSFTSLYAQRHMENLGRGLVAVRTSSNEVFISWRMVGSEPADVAFNLYRGDTKLNASPIVETTTFTDNIRTDEEYRVRPIINGNEQEASAPASVWKDSYKSIPLQRPAGGTTPDGVNYTYAPNDLSVGDLDGDGEYEIVLKWNPSNAKDNSHHGYTGNVFIDAYEIDGTHLWRIDLGVNIRAGAHYTQFIVYDLDSDGKAEVAMKTADGTKDGTGKIIGDASADYRNERGRILEGPEFLTVFNGQTGAAMATTDYIPARGNVESWGDSYGNRSDRFLAGVGYFDGERPSLLMTRGYYTRSVLVAWDWRNGELSKRWVFDSDEAGKVWAGQGNHSLSVADVDSDGKDEVIFGSMTIDNDGTGLYTSELGHGDAMHVSDLNPERPGLEIWTAHEEPGEYEGNGLWLRDAVTGEKLWGVPANFDVGRAMAADIDPRYKGYEVWGSTGNLYSITGTEIGTARPSMNFGSWWDGDLQRELLDGTTISKWNYTAGKQETLLNAGLFGAVRNNGTKANPGLSADILGDWREEVIYGHSNGSELLLFTTTIPTNHRFYTFMHDPQYRLAVAWQNVAYNQPPHTSFYVGEGMANPPDPSILLVDNQDQRQGNLKLPGLLKDNLILQQQTEVGLWGWAGPGEEVEIYGSWDPGKVVIVKTNANGEWKASIPTSEAGGPYELIFKAGNTITLKNVLLGEVWVCSGQSNMHFPVAPIENSGWATGVVNYQEEIANADYPEIRMFTVARKVADEPQEDVEGERGWEVSSPSTVGNFSAVAYFFARELHEKTGLPIGIINTSWGGTPAESWIQKEVLESDTDFQAILGKYEQAVAEYPEAFSMYKKELAQWKEEAEEAKRRGEKPGRAPKGPIGPDHNKSPYKLYNAMVAPLLPYTIKGAIWYQGESNADRAHQYRRLFPAMIRNWREDWGTDFPFYFAQIAPQRIMNPEIREAQLLTMLSVPKTGMAVLTDAGDSLDIHPKNKQVVGKRLALWALAKEYGLEEVVYSGPVYKSMKIKRNKIILKFDYVDGGLVAKGGPLTEFTIAGKDQRFLPARAEIKGKTIVVWSNEVPDPVAVRFAWRNVPAPNLYNASGLPASPFRTDDWPGETEGKVWFNE